MKGDRRRGLSTTDTNTSSASTNQNQSEQGVSGTITMFGWPGGIGPDGNANSSVRVLIDIDGCGKGGNDCSIVEIEDSTDFCNVTKIGDTDKDGGVGDFAVLNNISAAVDTDEVADGIQGTEDITVAKGIGQFFGQPMVVQNDKGVVLACAVFEEIKDESITKEDAATEDVSTSGEDEIKDESITKEDAATEDVSTPGEEDNTPSGANSRSGTSAALTIFAASSVLVVAATLL